eukprot:TRINITY_DN312_c0_g1_i1.p3 TRINITY_DN312_c0_g1~~TRINITY_DN312_c0_g1_i1.p3  ORF type:complete len:72 (+),score=11.37 TRINITY_DN312_c0_g1_i1:441-656(+)
MVFPPENEDELVLRHALDKLLDIQPFSDSERSNRFTQSKELYDVTQGMELVYQENNEINKTWRVPDLNEFY